jgi:predicted DNA-binding protein (MmcQ/YjbR family)
VAEDLRAVLLAHALGLPDAWEDHPWEEVVAKVGKKVFVFFGGPLPKSGVRITVKLPESHEEALLIPWVTPAGYGLDRGRWVTIDAPADAPVEMLEAWIDESYRTVAPKRR